jgi:hypothetical protein
VRIYLSDGLPMIVFRLSLLFTWVLLLSQNWFFVILPYRICFSHAVHPRFNVFPWNIYITIALTIVLHEFKYYKFACCLVNFIKLKNWFFLMNHFQDITHSIVIQPLDGIARFSSPIRVKQAAIQHCGAKLAPPLRYSNYLLIGLLKCAIPSHGCITKVQETSWK